MLTVVLAKCWHLVLVGFKIKHRESEKTRLSETLGRTMLILVAHFFFLFEPPFSKRNWCPQIWRQKSLEINLFYLMSIPFKIPFVPMWSRFNSLFWCTFIGRLLFSLRLVKIKNGKPYITGLGICCGWGFSIIRKIY